MMRAFYNEIKDTEFDKQEIILNCQINAPDEQAVVFNQSSSTVSVHQAYRPWYRRCLLQSTQAERQDKTAYQQFFLFWTNLGLIFQTYFCTPKITKLGFFNFGPILTL